MPSIPALVRNPRSWEGWSLAKSNVKEAAASLYGAKQRSLLALIGIVVGIGSVIALVSIGLIFKQEALKQFKELGTDSLSVRSGFGAEGIDLDIALALADETPSIAAVAPWVGGYDSMVHAGKELMRNQVLGVTESFRSLRKLQMESGRFLSDLDYRQYYCVVGSEVSDLLRQAGVGEIIGARIKLQGRLHTVVGVLKPAPATSDIDANKTAFVPITAALRTFSSSEIQRIQARMAPDAHYSDATADALAYFNRTQPHLDVEVISAMRLIEQIQRQMQLITLLLGAIGSIALIVGGVGIMNVMLVSVAERRKEIGVRRALGARRRDIQNQFLTESFILSMVGGLLGILLGLGSSLAICLFTGWEFSVSLTSILLGLGVSSAVGFFFGLYPANRAARLDPIIALQAP